MRARRGRYSLVLPAVGLLAAALSACGGEPETLLVIPNFSFDWQLPYVLKDGAVKLPKGTKMECVALYDNSAFNPFNPDPAATVRSGLQTYHEMMNGFFFYVAADEDLRLDIDPKTGRPKPAG